MLVPFVEVDNTEVPEMLESGQLPWRKLSQDNPSCELFALDGEDVQHIRDRQQVPAMLLMLEKFA